MGQQIKLMSYQASSKNTALSNSSSFKGKPVQPVQAPPSTHQSTYRSSIVSGGVGGNGGGGITTTTNWQHQQRYTMTSPGMNNNNSYNSATNSNLNFIQNEQRSVAAAAAG